ncbi:MAG: DUF2922 domain-containing protein [Limosilactobacillus sp.]|uniref:DUF2922 domain-containing protein n=1 Tax=Limosilactobacillus sp. TaxID=2773925 RepID=UPI00270B53BC|nr:DUF2922 domain-containing protein [Limosilactobacillus sp.]
MKTLNLTFKGSLGKKHVMKLNYASENLSAETVRQAMKDMASSQAFANDTEILYVTPLSAKYTETVTTPLFDDSDAE